MRKYEDLPFDPVLRFRINQMASRYARYDKKGKPTMDNPRWRWVALWFGISYIDVAAVVAYYQTMNRKWLDQDRMAWIDAYDAGKVPPMY